MHLLSHISIFCMAAFTTMAMLTSCADNDEPVAQQKIALSGHCKAPSRTDDTESVISDYRLWVTALYRSNNSGLYLLDNKEFAYNVGDNCWHGSNFDYYYPLDGKLDFVAFASTTGKKPIFNPLPTIWSNITDASYINEVTISFNKANWLDGSDDVLASEVTDDVPGGFVTDRKVDLNFKHLLANIRFTFSAETTDAEENFRVTRIVIDNLYLTGKVVLTRDARGDNWKSIEWLDGEYKNQKQLEYASESITPLFNKPATTFVDFYIPGQRVSPTGASTPKPKFTIYYQYLVGSNKTIEMEYIVDREFTLPQKIENGVNIASWEPGKRYTYNVVCNILPHIEFLVTYDEEDLNGLIVDKWVDETGVEL